MTTPTNTPTPRTDEAAKPFAKWTEPPVCGSFARTLERENQQQKKDEKV